MPNENKPTENQAPVSAPDAATTPIDLASAFKALNQANRESAQESVDPAQNTAEGEGNEPGGSMESAEIGQEIPGESSNDVATSSSDGGDVDYTGGSTDNIEAIDFNSVKQGLLRDIQQNAVSQIRKEFNDQNIGYYSANELTVRDENTGQVRFRNPDVMDERDPNYYFNSRTEMQQFIQAWNQGVDFEFRKAVNERQQKLMADEAPKARLMDFMPRWQRMDETTKQILDDLLEGYEVRDARGEHIGFSVDLNSMADHAEKIASKFGTKIAAADQNNASTEQQSPQASSPALDMQSGNGKSEDEAEPKNIGEALKMFDKKNKGGK